MRGLTSEMKGTAPMYRLYISLSSNAAHITSSPTSVDSQAARATMGSARKKATENGLWTASWGRPLDPRVRASDP